MIVEYLRYEIDGSRQGDFIAAYTAAATPLLDSPYALSFDICQCVEAPDQFILRIEWTSPEDHLQRFRGSEPFKAFFAHVRPYFDDIVEMRHYTPLVASKAE